MNAVIKTSQATINTATISVRMLHVDGRNLTQNLFKQLPEAPIIRKDGTLNTRLDPWGIVRYSIGEHTHWIVATNNGVLYRCPIVIPSDIGGKYFTVQYVKWAIDALEKQLEVQAWVAAVAQWETVVYPAYEEAMWDYRRHNEEWRKRTGCKDSWTPDPCAKYPAAP